MSGLLRLLEPTDVRSGAAPSAAWRATDGDCWPGHRTRASCPCRARIRIQIFGGTMSCLCARLLRQLVERPTARRTDCTAAQLPPLGGALISPKHYRVHAGSQPSEVDGNKQLDRLPIGLATFSRFLQLPITCAFSILTDFKSNSRRKGLQHAVGAAALAVHLPAAGEPPHPPPPLPPLPGTAAWCLYV